MVQKDVSKACLLTLILPSHVVLSSCLFYIVCMCMYGVMCMFICLFVGMCVWRTGIFAFHSLSYISRQGLLLQLRASHSANLDNQLAVEIPCLSSHLHM